MAEPLWTQAMLRPVRLLDHHACERRDDQWRALRRQGIGASEIAAVLGINPPEWDSAFALWWRKREPTWDDGDSDRLRVARRLEPVVVDEWRDRYGADWDVWPTGLYQHPQLPWMLATPDRALTPTAGVHEPGCRAGETYLDDDGATMEIVCDCQLADPDQPAQLLECKTSGSYDGWGEAGTDDIPAQILAQCRWQRLVLGAQRVRVAVMFLPSCSVREYVVGPDPDDEALMIAAGQQFMARLGCPDGCDLDHEHTVPDPPDPDWTPATTRTLHRLHPKVEPVDVEIPAELAGRYLAAVREHKQADRAKEQAKNELLELLGGGWRAVCAGKRIAQRSVFEQRRLDVERLRREQPAIAAEYAAVTEVHRLTPAPAREDKKK